MRDDLNPLQQMVGLRPSVTETVQRSVHTEVTIPQRQAQLATLLRFGANLAVVVMVALIAAAVYLLAFTPDELSGWLGIGCIVLLVVGGCLYLAMEKPRRLLLERMEREIADPNRDSELQEMLSALMAGKQPEVQIVREPVPVTVNGVVLKDDKQQHEQVLSQGFLDLMEFVELAGVRGLARADWCPTNGQRVRLASGRMVTRGAWSDAIEALVGWGLVKHTPTGFDWTVSQQEALSMLRNAAATPPPTA